MIPDEDLWRLLRRTGRKIREKMERAVDFILCRNESRLVGTRVVRWHPQPATFSLLGSSFGKYSLYFTSSMGWYKSMVHCRKKSEEESASHMIIIPRFARLADYDTCVAFIMSTCWAAEPSEHPTATCVVSSLGGMM